MAAEAALSLAWSETPEDTFWRVVAQLNFSSCSFYMQTDSEQKIFEEQVSNYVNNIANSISHGVIKTSCNVEVVVAS